MLVEKEAALAAKTAYTTPRFGEQVGGAAATAAAAAAAAAADLSLIPPTCWPSYMRCFPPFQCLPSSLQAYQPLKVQLKRKHWAGEGSEAASASKRCTEIFNRQVCVLRAALCNAGSSTAPSSSTKWGKLGDK